MSKVNKTKVETSEPSLLEKAGAVISEAFSDHSKDETQVNETQVEAAPSEPVQKTKFEPVQYKVAPLPENAGKFEVDGDGVAITEKSEENLVHLLLMLV